MSAGAKLALYLSVLAVVFAGAYGVGSRFDPLAGSPPAAEHPSDTHTEPVEGDHP